MGNKIRSNVKSENLSQFISNLLKGDSENATLLIMHNNMWESRREKGYINFDAVFNYQRYIRRKYDDAAFSKVKQFVAAHMIMTKMLDEKTVIVDCNFIDINVLHMVILSIHLRHRLLLPVDILNYYTLIKNIIDKGVDINVTDFYGNTALHYLAYTKYAELIPYLCHTDLLQLKNNNGLTPFMIAYKYGTRAMKQALITTEKNIVQIKEPVSTKETQPEVCDTTCVICCDAKRNIAFEPCAHMVSCADCTKSLTTCPICRSVILRKIKILLV